jgi:uncharacterized protein (DUF433 family)
MGDQTNSAYITADPGILGGKPVIAGTRISVQLVLEKLRDGWTIDDLLEDYPQLMREQIEAALQYAAEVLGAPAAS